jgi:hypothetical protein
MVALAGSVALTAGLPLPPEWSAAFLEQCNRYTGYLFFIGLLITGLGFAVLHVRDGRVYLANPLRHSVAGWSVLQVLGTLVGIWVFVGMFKIPPGISRVGGAWETGGRFSPHRLVTEAEARNILWQNIRFFSGLFPPELLLRAYVLRAICGATRVQQKSGSTATAPTASER